MRQLLSILFLFQLTCSVAQPLSEEETKGIDALFPEERFKKPGFIVTVLRKDRIVYNRAVGYINVRQRIPFRIDSRIALASVSKQFTAMGILLLEEEGKLSLDDDIHKFIPELPSYPQSVTLRHLLAHTSGIRDHITILGWENNQQSHFYHFPGMLNELRDYCWTSFPSGQDFAYSNTGYMLLAYVIERVSGLRYEIFMQERIFEPLDMASTEVSFRRKAEEYGHSTPYDYRPKSKRFVARKIREVNALGATGIYTTVSDLLKWNHNFKNPIVGNPALIARMETAATLSSGKSVNYNNGIIHRTINGQKILEHSGGWANFNIQYIRVPETELTIIVASNNELDYPIEIADKVLHLFLPQQEAPSVPPRKFEEIGLVEGSYLAENMTLREVKNDKGLFTISHPTYGGEKNYQLFEAREEGCFSDAEGFEFCPEENGFEWSNGGYFNTPTHYQLLVDNPDFNYAAAVGRYANCELGSVRLKYSKMRKEYILIGSLIKRIRLEKVYGQVFESKKKGFKVYFIDAYTFQMGNNRVFGLEFKKTD